MLRFCSPKMSPASECTVRLLEWGILFFFFFIYFYQLAANYFTTLQWVLSYIDMNQPWSYMSSPSRSSLLPPSPPNSSGSSQCTRPEHLSRASHLRWWSVSLEWGILAWHRTSPLSPMELCPKIPLLTWSRLRITAAVIGSCYKSSLLVCSPRFCIFITNYLKAFFAYFSSLPLFLHIFLPSKSITYIILSASWDLN